jgi:nucleotide-binding universal stress UspA family protein
MARLFRSILVPHDFSEPANHALRVAAELAGTQRGGRITVLHVVVPFVPVAALPPMDGTVYVPPPSVAGERKHLEAAVKKALGARRVRVRCDAVLGDPYQRIVAAGRRHDAIVMATSGRTGLSHLLIGSVAEKVVRHATVPVITVRPDAARKAARRSSGGRRKRARRAARRTRR